MKSYSTLVMFIIGINLISQLGASQSIEAQLEAKLTQKANILKQLAQIEDQIIDLKMARSISDIKALGLPSEDYIEHKAMILDYDEAHEQARWVAHMILPEIKDGKVVRTNDFRIDPKVTSGTATQIDYFTTDTLEGGKVTYDGYGYDRGHLAASADFRWSEKALSESYFYSNMSPQLADFNREIWADLERLLRRYVITNEVPLHIVTLPILENDLPKIERSKNQVSVPRKFAKVAYDPINNKGIGFVLEHKRLDRTLDHYAMSIDQVEAIAGMDFFQTISEEVEAAYTVEDWFDNIAAGDVDPIHQPSMPPGYFNTVVGGKKIGSNAIVCGKLVSSRYSRKGNLWINLDKNYPNNVFNIFIRKEHLPNFSYDVVSMYQDQQVCVEGRVQFLSDNPTINIKDDRAIKHYENE